MGEEKTIIKRSNTMKKRGNTLHFDIKITYPCFPGVLPIPGHVTLLRRVGSYKLYQIHICECIVSRKKEGTIQ